MQKSDETLLDPTRRAEKHLNTILEDGVPAPDVVVLDEKLQKFHMPEVYEATTDEKVIEEDVTHIEVDAARFEDPLLTRASDRDKVRLLIFTTNPEVLREGSVAYERILDQREFFLEIHVVVLTYGGSVTEPTTTRILDTIWLYQTNSRSWWTVVYDAYRIVESQLVFSGGFRADVVVAEDVFESGFVGLRISRKYERPFQVHVTEDFFDPEYIDLHPHPILYTWVSRHVLSHTRCVRTRTEFQRQAVIERYPKIKDTTEILPSYYNLRVWEAQTPAVKLNEMYPQFKFIILHMSAMRASSHTHEVMMGAAPLLRRYPTIGLVIVGNGPLRSFLERQAIALGLQNQIEFLPMTDDVISYMKTAHIFIQLSDDGSEDDLILQAATVKLPMILHSAGLGSKLFVDGESACFSTPEDTMRISDHINMYLNENQSRSKYSLNAHDIVFERIEQDYQAYIEEYNESIVRCLHS